MGSYFDSNNSNRHKIYVSILLCLFKYFFKYFYPKYLPKLFKFFNTYLKRKILEITLKKGLGKIQLLTPKKKYFIFLPPLYPRAQEGSILCHSSHRKYESASVRGRQEFAQLTTCKMKIRRKTADCSSRYLLQLGVFVGVNAQVGVPAFRGTNAGDPLLAPLGVHRLVRLCLRGITGRVKFLAMWTLLFPIRHIFWGSPIILTNLIGPCLPSRKIILKLHKKNKKEVEQI
jgi:hypothetical protein